MATSLQGTLSVDARFSLSNVAAPNQASNIAQINTVESMTDGNGSYQANKLFSEERTNNGNYDYDLSGTLVDPLGNTIVFSRITQIIIENRETDAGKILSVGAGSNPVSSLWLAAGDGVKIGPGGRFVLSSPIDGFTVTAATADILRIATGAAYKWRIIIAGS